MTRTCVYLIQSRTVVFYYIGYTRSSQPHGANTTDVYVDRNISYVTAPSHTATSGSQTTQATRAAGDKCGTGTVAEYSRIGPSYATTDNSRRRQPVAGRNQVSARLSERYEFSEAYLAAAGESGCVQGEGARDYEVPLQNGEHDEYSHLRHIENKH